MSLIKHARRGNITNMTITSYDDLPDSHTSHRNIQAAFHYHPDRLQKRAQYRIPDPDSPYGHYHVQVHYHYDLHSNELYPHTNVQYHLFRA
uniref:Uncharacterized protein n=1 Tax=Ascaris lumbricoides TaxID=6252 RepID=A0A0M3HMJ1_ASCLU